jgi:hypothetical protein
LREKNIKNVGIIEGVGDAYLDGVKLKEKDIIPNMTDKNTKKNTFSFVNLGVRYNIDIFELLIF